MDKNTFLILILLGKTLFPSLSTWTVIILVLITFWENIAILSVSIYFRIVEVPDKINWWWRVGRHQQK
jgi:hypothetical protein